MERDEAIEQIKTALRKRSGHAWSVTGGRGTSWGWIHINSLPSRRVDGNLSLKDRTELGKLLDKDIHCQGESIPASYEYRMEYVQRAKGEPVTVVGTPYWD